MILFFLSRLMKIYTNTKFTMKFYVIDTFRVVLDFPSAKQITFVAICIINKKQEMSNTYVRDKEEKINYLDTTT